MQRKHYSVHLDTLLSHLGIRGEYVLRGYVEQDTPWLHIHTLADDSSSPLGLMKAIERLGNGYVDDKDLLKGDK